jgi:hypothetical protein
MKVYKEETKTGEQEERGKTPEKPKNIRKPKDPYKTSPQNPETKTLHQRPSCLAPARTKTPSIIVNSAL